MLFLWVEKRWLCRIVWLSIVIKSKFVFILLYWKWFFWVILIIIIRCLLESIYLEKLWMYVGWILFYCYRWNEYFSNWYDGILYFDLKKLFNFKIGIVSLWDDCGLRRVRI